MHCHLNNDSGSKRTRIRAVDKGMVLMLELLFLCNALWDLCCMATFARSLLEPWVFLF